MKCLDKKRIKMKQGETLALNERIMLSLVSTGVSAWSSGQVAAQEETGRSPPWWLIHRGPVWIYQGLLRESCGLFEAA